LSVIRAPSNVRDILSHVRGGGRAIVSKAIGIAIDPFPTDARVADLPWPDAFVAAVDRHRHVLLAAMATLFVVGFNGRWQIEPDSALYLTLARSLSRGQGYTYHGLPHNLVYPGLPFALAVLFRWFGGYSILACDAFILMCGIAALGLTYRLFLLAVDRPTAVIVTLLTGVAHEYSRYCYEIMPEMPFLAGVMAVLAGHEALIVSRSPARFWDWVIFIGGVFIVVNTKPMMLALLASWIVAAAWHSRRNGALRRTVWMSVGVMGLVALFFWYEPRHPFSASDGSSYESIAEQELMNLPTRWSGIVVGNVSDLLGKSAARAVFGTPLGRPIINAIFGALILIAGISLTRFRLLWGLWIAATIAKLTLLYSHDRYLIPILPLLFFGWWRIVYHVCRQIRGRMGNAVFAVLMAGTFGSNLLETGRFLVEQHGQLIGLRDRDGAVVPLETMAGELSARTNPADIILSLPKTSRILTFLADRTVLEPGDAMVDLAGRRVFIVAAVGRDDPLQDRWLAHVHVTAKANPLVTLTSQTTQGDRLALYAASSEVVRP
jgi:hypothetical protein